MQIEDYSFGELRVGGTRYTSDLLICGDQIKSEWWRRLGHSLCRNDLTWVLEQEPDLLIIGTGKSGQMEVPDDLKAELKENFDLIIAETTKAVVRFNQNQQSDLQVAAAFHLTC